MLGYNLQKNLCIVYLPISFLNFGCTFALNSLRMFRNLLSRKKQVTNPFEVDQVVGITNYIDVGLELATRYLFELVVIIEYTWCSCMKSFVPYLFLYLI